MKKKILVTFIIALTTINIYSQKDLIETENRIIISSITNEFWTSNNYVYPFVYTEYTYTLPQFFAQYTVAPNDKTTYIKETYFKSEMKFGKVERTELPDLEVEYFYNSEGILKQVNYNSKEINMNIGTYGEIIENQTVYDTNANGISKIIYYNKEGKLISRVQINYNNLGQIISYDSYLGNSEFKNYTNEYKYDPLGRVIKSTVLQNFNDKPVKSIPREAITYDYQNLILTCSYAQNEFAEGIFEYADFGFSNGYKITRNKTVQEINQAVKKRWVDHNVFSEITLIDDKKNNYWSEKRIYRRVYGGIEPTEILYIIIREYK